MKFRVICNCIGYKGKVAKKGDVVESDTDLSVKFPLAFAPTGSVVRRRRDEDVPVKAQEEPEAVSTPAPTDEPTPESEPVQEAPSFSVVQAGRNRYNVVNNTTGKAVNSKPLTKAKANALIADFTDDGESADEEAK